jgi:4-hydroxy-tetrahydrodipicolinate reductase
MTRVVLTGVSGRMGQTLVHCVLEQLQFRLVGATERVGHGHVGQDVGVVSNRPALGVVVHGSLHEALQAEADVVIDFSSPVASLEHAETCARRGVALVVGTTGFSAAQQQMLQGFGQRIPLLWSPNMSVGVNVMIALAAQLAVQLGHDFDVEIVETHHRHKKDAPSGTALRLAGAIATALGRSEKDFRTAREGQVGERSATEIGVQSLRGGDVVGEHTVFYFGDGERVELTHRATSRAHFAKGALRAAAWLKGRPAGFYAMQDVLKNA